MAFCIFAIKGELNGVIVLLGSILLGIFHVFACLWYLTSFLFGWLVAFIGFRLSSVRYLLALEPDNYSVSSLALFTGINRETIVKLAVLSVKHIHSITAAALLTGPIFIRYADISEFVITVDIK